MWEVIVLKILSIILVLCSPSITLAQSCSDYDREIGKEISKIFYAMRQLYLNNMLSDLVVDRIMTEMHLKYNEEYRLAFQIAARHTPNECVAIRDMGVSWARSYEEIIINEINIGTR